MNFSFIWRVSQDSHSSLPKESIRSVGKVLCRGYLKEKRKYLQFRSYNFNSILNPQQIQSNIKPSRLILDISNNTRSVVLLTAPNRLIRRRFQNILSLRGGRLYSLGVTGIGFTILYLSYYMRKNNLKTFVELYRHLRQKVANNIITLIRWFNLHNQLIKKFKVFLEISLILSMILYSRLIIYRHQLDRETFEKECNELRHRYNFLNRFYSTLNEKFDVLERAFDDKDDELVTLGVAASLFLKSYNDLYKLLVEYKSSVVHYPPAASLYFAIAEENEKRLRRLAVFMRSYPGFEEIVKKLKRGKKD